MAGGNRNYLNWVWTGQYSLNYQTFVVILTPFNRGLITGTVVEIAIRVVNQQPHVRIYLYLYVYIRI